MWKVSKREEVIKGMGRGAFEEIGVSHKGRYMRKADIPKLFCYSPIKKGGRILNE